MRRIRNGSNNKKKKREKGLLRGRVVKGAQKKAGGETNPLFFEPFYALGTKRTGFCTAKDSSKTRDGRAVAGSTWGGAEKSTRITPRL